MKVVELAGGVGGAKLAEGLAGQVGPDLTVVVNTADDLELYGLAVWPDHDTVLYTLADLDDEARGWGLRDETWTVMSSLARLGDEAWFRLGDRDLATHLWRTDHLRAGERPTEVALGLCRQLGVASRILPMADEPVRTEVRTDDGWLEFQEYFVRRHQEPEVHEVRFRGIEVARVTPEVRAALDAAEAVVIAPSNPIVSIAPIVALPGIREALGDAVARGVPVVAVSGIVGGRALKGPADRMLRSLGFEPSALGVARQYAGLVTDLVIDTVDAELAEPIRALGMRCHVRDTIMGGDAGRARLAGEVLEIVAGDRRDPRARSGGRAEHGSPARDHRPDPDEARSGSRRGPVYAIVPVGTLDGAKSRLGAVLDAEERRDLVAKLAERTIRSVVATPSIEAVLVVTPDDEVRRLALDAGARPIRQRGRGLNAGLRQGRDEAIAAGAGAIVIVPVDLPQVSPDLLEPVIAVLAEHAPPLVAIVPDRHGRGTNALLLAPPDVIDLHFGGDSRAAHTTAAAAAGATLVVLGGPLSDDLDTPDDLLRAQARAPEVVGG